MNEDNRKVFLTHSKLFQIVRPYKNECKNVISLNCFLLITNFFFVFVNTVTKQRSSSLFGQDDKKKDKKGKKKKKGKKMMKIDEDEDEDLDELANFDDLDADDEEDKRGKKSRRGKSGRGSPSTSMDYLTNNEL